LSGEALTLRLRALVFGKLLRQEVAYFDQPENNTGALCTRLATDAADVQGVSDRDGTMDETIFLIGYRHSYRYDAAEYL
jgi:ATP-binding cassette, subfamily B (MDR/TAP), member 1